MSGQARHGWVRAAACAAALAAPLAAGGCASSPRTSAATNVGAATTAEASATASASASATPTATVATTATASAAAARNGTGGTKLTVSDGSSTVLMGGKAVDFGTEVHDPAWTPDGKKVAFIDGRGNLDVANADGSGRVEAAKNPGGETWSHPTWQVTGKDPVNGIAPRDFIFFGSSKSGGTLEVVSGTAHDGTPKQATLEHGAGPGPLNPMTGNLWISIGGPVGTGVYEHEAAGATTVYLRDDYLRQQGSKLIDNASEPSYFDTMPITGGTSGTEGVVFVRVVNGHKHVFVSKRSITSDTWTLVDLTPTASYDCTEPAVSPDGKTVAFSTPSGVETVSVSGGKPTKVTDTPGFPAFR